MYCKHLVSNKSQLATFKITTRQLRTKTNSFSNNKYLQKLSFQKKQPPKVFIPWLFDLHFFFRKVLLVALHLRRSIPIDIHQLHAMVLKEFLLMCLGKATGSFSSRWTFQGNSGFMVDTIEVRSWEVILKNNMRVVLWCTNMVGIW